MSRSSSVITTGDKGITDGLIKELDGALEHHELIKVKVRVGDRDARDEMIEALVDKSDAILVSRVGNIAALYRPNKKKPKLTLTLQAFTWATARSSCPR